MSGFIILYVFGVVVCVITAMVFYMGEGREGTRQGARIILLAPIWPLLIPVFGGRGIKWLWKTADWRGVEEEEAILREQRRGGYGRGW